MAPASLSGLQNWGPLNQVALIKELKSRKLDKSFDRVSDLRVRLTASDLGVPETQEFKIRATYLWSRECKKPQLKAIAARHNLSEAGFNFHLIGNILLHEFPPVKKSKAAGNRKQPPVACPVIRIEEEEDEEEEVVRIKLMHRAPPKPESKPKLSFRIANFLLTSGPSILLIGLLMISTQKLTKDATYL